MLQPLLTPISFKQDIQKLTEHFIGCEDVFERIDRWLNHHSERFFILVGKPCTGKSAIAARLTQVRKDIVAYHFCIARRSHTIDPNCVLLSLAAQLCKNLPEYANALVNTITPLHLSLNIEVNIGTIQNSQVLGIVIENLHTNNPQEALDVILRRPLKTISNQSKKDFLLLFDGLNEAVALGSSENLVMLLACADDLPQSIRFLCTTRMERRVLSLLKTSEVYKYDLEDRANTIRKYIHLRLESSDVYKKIQLLWQNPEIFINQLIDQAKDNFLYVKLVLNDVEYGRQFDGKIVSLPTGLSQIYHKFIYHFLEGISGEKIRSILGILAVAREPLSQKQISQFTGISLEDVNTQIRIIRQFFDVFNDDPEEKYSLFHQSFRDYLTDSNENCDFWCDPIQQHGYIVDSYWADAKLRLQEVANDKYVWIYLPYHLKQAGQDKKLRRLLLNFEWLQAKLSNTSIHYLVADYNLLPTDHDLVLIQHALRLSASVIGQDSYQLVSQLQGRLISHITEGVHSLIEQINKQQIVLPWFRCLTASLTPPGGSLVTTLYGHGNYISTLALVPDKRWIISASKDGTLQLWDIDSSKCLRTLEGHTDWVRKVVVTATGRYAISIADDRTIKQWNLDTGRSHEILEQYKEPVTALAAMLDGNRVIVALGTYEVGIWEVDLQQYNPLFRISDALITSITVLNQDNIIFVLNNCTFQLWDLNSQTCQRIYSGHNGSITTVATTPNEEWAVSASYDSTLKIWNLTNGEVKHTLQGHLKAVSSVVITPDGKQAVSASHDCTLKKWDLNTGQCISTFLAHHDWINCIAIIPESRNIVSASDDGALKVWDLDSSQQLIPRHHDDQINDLGLTLNDNRLISASRDKTLKIWNIKNQQCEYVLQGHEAQVLAVATTSNEQAISASADNTLKVWNLSTGKCIRTFKGHRGAVSDVAVFSDGKTVISASFDKTLRLWDISTGNCQRVFDGHQGLVTAVKVLPNNHQIISASTDKTLRIWDVYTGECQLQMEGHNCSLTDIAVTPDGNWAVSASVDRAVKLWNLGTGMCELTLGIHQAYIHAVSITADGYWAISGSEDNTLILWDLRQRRYATSFVGETKFKSFILSRDPNTWIIFAGDQIGQIHCFQIQF